MRSIIVPKNRTTVIKVNAGQDVSSDVIESQIRQEINQDSDLIAEWDVVFETDGTDGLLIFTIPASISSLIQENQGFMDIKRTSGTETYTVFDGTIKVEFPNVVTE